MKFYQSEASTAAMGPNYFEMNLDKVIGLAYWGAIDYLGESQGWPAKGWAQGVFDIALTPKPKAYFMKSFFSDEPLVRITVVEDKNSGIMWNGIVTGTDRQSELWNRPEGSKANLLVYTNADEVELLLNGKSLGRKSNPKDAKKRNQISWNDVTYQKGRLTAIAYKDGKAVARHQVITATGELKFEVEGDARIVAVTNGDINSNELNVTDRRSLWQGQAMVILRSGRQPSKITLKTTTPEFKNVTTKLETK